MFIHFGVKGTVRKAVWIDDRRTLKTKKGKHKTSTTITKISSESLLSVLAAILKSIVLIKILIKLLQLWSHCFTN